MGMLTVNGYMLPQLEAEPQDLSIPRFLSGKNACHWTQLNANVLLGYATAPEAENTQLS